ncbi:MAG: pentapeptide repeat-containing protein, partial [Paludibacter sp.]
MNFEEFKQEILDRAKKANACKGQYQRAAEATTIDELIEVLKDNINFAKNNDILTIELSKQYERPELFNVGKENAGFFNSGYLNSGDLNSGDLNSGYLNSGDLNSGDLNSGYLNSGDLNSGDLNSGYLNSGDLNSG